MAGDTFDRFSAPDRGRFGDNEHRSSRPTSEARSDLIDVTLALHHETPKAWRLSVDGVDKRAVWIPKALCEVTRSGKQQGGVDRYEHAVNLDIVHVTLRERLAKEKGLI